MEDKTFKEVMQEQFGYHHKNQTDLIKAIDKLTDAVVKTNWNIGIIRSVLEGNPKLAKKIKDAQEEKDQEEE